MENMELDEANILKYLQETEKIYLLIFANIIQKGDEKAAQLTIIISNISKKIE